MHISNTQTRKHITVPTNFICRSRWHARREKNRGGERRDREKGRGKYTIKFMSNPKVFRLQLSYIPDSRETRKVAEFKTSHLKPKG